MFVQTQRSVSSDSIESIKSPPVDQPLCIGNVIDNVPLEEDVVKVEEKPLVLVIDKTGGVLPAPGQIHQARSAIPEIKPKPSFARRLSASLHDIELKTAAIPKHRRPSATSPSSSLSSVSSTEDAEKIHEYVKVDHPREPIDALEILTDTEKIHEFVHRKHPREPKDALAGLTHNHLLRHPEQAQSDADKIHEFVKHNHLREPVEALEVLTHEHFILPAIKTHPSLEDKAIEKRYFDLALVDEHSVPKPLGHHELKDALKLALKSPGLTGIDRAREEAVWSAGHHQPRDALLALAC